MPVASGTIEIGSYTSYITVYILVSLATSRRTKRNPLYWAYIKECQTESMTHNGSDHCLLTSLIVVGST